MTLPSKTLIWPFVRAAARTNGQGASSAAFETIEPFIDLVSGDGSGLRCIEGDPIIRSTSWYKSSRTCEHGHVEDPNYLALLSQDRPLIECVPLVRTRTWFHSSVEPMLDLTDLPRSDPAWLMHLGSRAAAMTRASEASASLLPRRFLHELRIREEAPIHPDIVWEDPRHDPYQDTLKLRAETAIVRYINRQEDSGSVSIAGRRSFFVAISRTDILNSTAPAYRRTRQEGDGPRQWEEVLPIPDDYVP